MIFEGAECHKEVIWPLLQFRYFNIFCICIEGNEGVLHMDPMQQMATTHVMETSDSCDYEIIPTTEK